MTEPADVPPLLGVAHGSRDPAAAEMVRALLGEVQRRRPDLVVRPAFLDHEEPRLPDVTTELRATGQRFVVVPLLLGAAFHSRVDIPVALAGAPTAVQADVLGPHPLLLRALEKRLAEVGIAAGDPDVAVVLGAAGSADLGSVEDARDLATAWRAAGWWGVEAAFASAAQPTVEDAVAAFRTAGAPRVAVASYLLSPGLFADRMTAAGADATSPVLGDADDVAELVLLRYDAALDRPASDR